VSANSRAIDELVLVKILQKQLLEIVARLCLLWRPNGLLFCRLFVSSSPVILREILLYLAENYF